MPGATLAVPQRQRISLRIFLNKFRTESLTSFLQYPTALILDSDDDDDDGDEYMECSIREGDGHPEDNHNLIAEDVNNDDDWIDDDDLDSYYDEDDDDADDADDDDDDDDADEIDDNCSGNSNEGESNDFWPFKSQEIAELSLLLHGPHPVVSHLPGRTHILTCMFKENGTFLKMGRFLTRIP